MSAWGYEFYLLLLKVSLTRSPRSLVRDTLIQFQKIKFVSPSGHVIFSIFQINSVNSLIVFNYFFVTPVQNQCPFPFLKYQS